MSRIRSITSVTDCINQNIFVLAALAAVSMALPNGNVRSSEIVARQDNCLFGGDYFTCVGRGEEDCALECTCDLENANACLVCSSECITRVQAEDCSGCT